MGADIKQLRIRIKSVDSTLHLTKAMGLVASSKIRKATESMNKGKAYSRSLSEMVNTLTSYRECAKSPYMSSPETDKICLIVVAGDRGLAGGYNANIFKYLRDYPNADIIPIGKRACERYEGKSLLAEDFSYKDAKEIADRLCLEFCQGKYGKIGVLCTKYNSLMSQEAHIVPIFPLIKQESASKTSAIFEPDEFTVLNAVIPEYVAGVILSCVKESFASEVAARRVAMDSAGKNAQEMIDRLGLEYNRARQGAITQEITEIVAGSGI